MGKENFIEEFIGEYKLKPGTVMSITVDETTDMGLFEFSCGKRQWVNMSLMEPAPEKTVE